MKKIEEYEIFRSPDLSIVQFTRERRRCGISSLDEEAFGRGSLFTITGMRFTSNSSTFTLKIRCSREPFLWKILDSEVRIGVQVLEIFSNVGPLVPISGVNMFG